MQSLWVGDVYGASRLGERTGQNSITASNQLVRVADLTRQEVKAATQAPVCGLVIFYDVLGEGK
jgi:hypothetical protein